MQELRKVLQVWHWFEEGLTASVSLMQLLHKVDEAQVRQLGIADKQVAQL